MPLTETWNHNCMPLLLMILTNCEKVTAILIYKSSLVCDVLLLNFPLSCIQIIFFVTFWKTIIHFFSNTCTLFLPSSLEIDFKYCDSKFHYQVFFVSFFVKINKFSLGLQIYK